MNDEKLTVIEACARAASVIKPPKRTRQGWCALIPEEGAEVESVDVVLEGSASYGAVLETITNARAIYAIRLLTGLTHYEAGVLVVGRTGDTRARVREALALLEVHKEWSES